MKNKSITENHIKDLYSKFYTYIKTNGIETIGSKKQKHIVEDIKQLIYNENQFDWNEASLSDYINNLIYMLKGETFARTINKYAETFFIEQICKDFDENICNNAKFSLQKHKQYYQELLNKQKSKKQNNKNHHNTTHKQDTEVTYNHTIKNIILYGVPGVGKTHNVAKLIRLIEEGKNEMEIFSNIQNNERSDEKLPDSLKERIRFVTFHQNFGYEDFIEGFRPNEEGSIELQDGIFKTISQKANKNLEDSKKDNTNLSRELKFDKLLESLVEKIETTIEEDGVYPLTEKVYIFGIENDAFRYKGDNWTIHASGIRIRFDILKKLYLANVRSRQEIKQVENIGGLAQQHATYFWKILEKIYQIESNQEIQLQSIEPVKLQSFYLVIDEINRGNISKIFGELITLIEEDKRDDYEITLPYSKQPFSVPSNLYIIGTMNSTDKSIALIDIALRRRFTFLKMRPQDELIEYEKAKRIFNKLNEFLQERLDDDHLLGHSYFMNIHNESELNFVLQYKIQPLLEEYFYGDIQGYNDALGFFEEKTE